AENRAAPRTAEKEGNPWPNLYFSRENKGMEYNFIGEKLEGYKPRFMLLIADACNSLIPDAWAPPLQRRMFGRVIDEELLKQNYKHLFLETSGIIMVTSSEAGEPSWDTGVGGLYTRAFIECLNQAVKSSALPSWETLLDTSAMKIAGEEQHPYYRIDLDISSLVSRGQLGLDTSP
ncbi:MAG: hypothetical protein ACE5GN_06470, partial [Waddliaceae bacterium]